MRPPLTGPIIRDVRMERQAQIDKWGEQRHLDGTGDPYYLAQMQYAQDRVNTAAQSSAVSWDLILLEEVYEALAEKPNTPELRNELVQAMAVLSAWIEDIDDRGAA